MMRIKCTGNIFFYLLLGTIIQLEARQTGKLWSEVKNNNGVPALYINGELQPPYAYMSYLGEEKFYREAAASGLHLYNIPAYLGDRGINSSSGIGPFRPHIWTGEDEYDFSGIVRDFDEVLRADREAKVIIRVHLDPPAWWEKENPDEVCLLPDGGSLRTSFASMKWRYDAGEVLRDMVNWLLESDYAPYLVGIHVAGGFTEEWFYHYKDYFYDESPARKKEFRKWLKNKYNGEVVSLQQSWQDNSVDFDNARPADISGKDRERGWRNNGIDRRYFDTFDFHAGLMVDHIAYFCHIVKETSGNSLLTGAFYGYHYFVSDPGRGHGALARLLECPYLDYLSSPNDYNRVAGEDWAPFAAIKSVQLHGKLWLAENDTRTSISTLLKDRAPEIDPPGDWYSRGVWLGPEDMATSVSFLWKNLGRMLAHGYGGWWFDMWGGWFSDPELLFVIQKAQDFHHQYASGEYPEMEPEVAIVVDERLQFWDKSYGDLTGEITGNRYALGKTGIPYDLYLRTDLDKLPMDQYKAIWLMGILELQEQEQEKMEAFLAKETLLMHTSGEGTTVYTPGNNQREFKKKIRWSASELGELWQKSNIHRYSDEEDVIYAGRGWLTVHTIKGGKKTIKLPFSAKVTDPVKDEVISESSSVIEVDLLPVSTRLLRIYQE